jgi:phage terminase large subunit-like protein
VFLFPKEDGAFDVLPFFWVPEDSIDERTKKDGVPYRQWVDEGYIIATPGNVTDYNFIKAQVLEFCEAYQVQMIEFDRYNSSQLVIDLTEEGVPMQPFGQGFLSMSAPTKELEKLVLEGKIHHYGNPVLAWMCGNVEIKRDPAGNIKIDKGKSKEKVDGMVGLAMALGGYMSDDHDSGYIYEDRDLLVL